MSPLRKGVAIALAVMGLLVTSGFGIGALWAALGGNGGIAFGGAQTVAIPAGMPITQPLNKREQLFARMKVPVEMPSDLVANISQKDPRLSNWIAAWQKNHLGVESQDRTWLAPLLLESRLSASDLWRLCRQVDRGGVSDACRYLAAAAVRRARREIAQHTATMDGAYIHEFSMLQRFLEYGASTDPEALEIWANLIINAPEGVPTADMCDSARLGLSVAKYAEREVDGASQLLSEFQSEVAHRSKRLSDANRNELNLMLGTIAMEKGRYGEALEHLQAVPHVDSDDAIAAMAGSALALAHLGRLDEAKHRVAEFVVRYHFDEDPDGRFTEKWGDELATQLTKIAHAKPGATSVAF